MIMVGEGLLGNGKVPFHGKSDLSWLATRYFLMDNLALKQDRASDEYNDWAG